MDEYSIFEFVNDVSGGGCKCEDILIHWWYNYSGEVMDGLSWKIMQLVVEVIQLQKVLRTIQEIWCSFKNMTLVEA